MKVTFIDTQVFELLTGAWLFQPTEGETWSVQDEHLANMLENTGYSAFPPALLEKARWKAKYLKDDGMFSLARCSTLYAQFGYTGTLLNIDELLPVSLEQAFGAYKTISERQAREASDFIRCCITLDPAQRPSATQLMKHAYLRSAFTGELEDY